MLYFQQKPDPVFTAILHEALDLLREDLGQMLADGDLSLWEANFPLSARCFKPKSAMQVAERLLKASRDADVYRVTDYHWLLLYECLEEYCFCHNDLAEGDPIGLLTIGDYRVGQIDFGLIVDLYFWDTDFLIPAEVVVGMGERGRKTMRLNDELYGIAQGWLPHPEELRLEHVKDPKWDYHDAAEPLSRVLTTFPPS